MVENVPEGATEIRIAVDKKLRELQASGTTVLTYPQEWVLDDEMLSDDEVDDIMHVYIPETALYSSIDHDIMIFIPRPPLIELFWFLKIILSHKVSKVCCKLKNDRHIDC